MKLYGAIDLHSTNNVTVLIDEQDQVVYQKRLPNDLKFDCATALCLSIEDGRDRGGIDVQLVLAGGWFDGARSQSSFGQHRSDPTIRGTEVHR